MHMLYIDIIEIRILIVYVDTSMTKMTNDISMPEPSGWRFSSLKKIVVFPNSIHKKINNSNKIV